MPSRQTLQRRIAIPIKVAIIGCGNCASSLVQGVEYYRGAPRDADVPGLMHVDLGGYHVGDIEFTTAFDVDARKVGRQLGQAIFEQPNNTVNFTGKPQLLADGAIVERGMTHDGIAPHRKEDFPKAPGETADIVDILKETGTDVVVNLLPVGSEEATRWYVERVLQAGCAFVNGIPVFIAREKYWQRRFQQRGLPVLGDDVKSQVGATIVHRQLARLFHERGVRLDRTYQLNVGGNMDFYNMLDRGRLESKKISKTNAVTSVAGHEMFEDDVHVGPSDYVPWLDDTKVAFIRLEGTTFGDVPLTAELRLQVVDSPNSAGVLIDAIRCAKLALDRGESGAVAGPSSYFFKSPPHQVTDDAARNLTEDFIAGRWVDFP